MNFVQKALASRKMIAIIIAATYWPGHVQAQNPATLLGFDDELALELPAGWKETLLEPAPARPARGPHMPNPLVPLLQARPEDEARNAQLTIVRDYAFNFGPSEMFPAAENQRRLNELALLKGYPPAQSNSGNTRQTGPEFATMDEVEGVSREGNRRIFIGVAFKQMGEYIVRCYWEFDESDAQARQEFNSWLGTLVSRNVRIADALNGKATLAETGNIRRSPQPSAGASPTPPEVAMNQGKLPVEGQPAVASPTPSPTPSGTVSDKARELMELYRDALVVIEGRDGRGSGFVCNLDGRPTALTNAHVLAGNLQPVFTTMDGKVLQLAEAFTGVDHDVCKISAPGAQTAFEIMGPADGTPKVGDAIAVLGNSEGAGVIKPLEGKIVGLGPNLVEVDAPFVPGNSGSPIVHLESGKVIGIATYLTIRKVDKDVDKGVETTVRRFGYRLDSVKNWEPVNWARFHAQAGQVKKILSVGEEFVAFLEFLRKNDGQLPQFGNTAIRRAVETFQGRLNSGRRMSETDLNSARREFLGNLRIATRSDIATFDQRTAYDYFRRQVVDETKFREQLYDAFTQALNARN